MEHQFLVWCCTMATTFFPLTFAWFLFHVSHHDNQEWEEVVWVWGWGSFFLLEPTSPQHTTSTSPACTCISCTTSSCAYDALAIGRVSRGRGMRGTHLAHSSPALCTPQDLHCSISSIMHLVSSWQGEWWPCSEVRGGQRDEEDDEIWCSTRMTACCLVVLVVGARMVDGGCWGEDCCWWLVNKTHNFLQKAGFKSRY